MWDWAVSMGSYGYDYCYSLSLDPSGNTYATGYFQGVVDFDPGPWEYVMDAGTSTAIYLTKLDTDGSLLWAIAIKGPGYKAGSTVVTDAYGNVYLAGLFTGQLVFGTDSSDFILTASGSNATFISKFTSTGSLIWAKAVGGPEYANGATMAIGGSGTGSVYVAGNFSGVVDFDPDTTVVELTGVGTTDTYLMKLDTSGNLMWARSFGGTEGVYCRQIAIDPSAGDHIYSVGYFEGTADFDPDTAQVLSMSSLGGYDMFISKLSSSGDLIWAKRIGGTGFDKAMAVAVDTSGTNSIYLTGAFQGTVDFDPGPGIFDLNSTADFDVFVLKLTSSGELEWAKNYGGSSYEYGMEIVVDPLGSGSTHTVGYFSGVADLDPDPLSTYNVTSAGNTDLFISHLDASGNLISAMAAGGSAPDVALAVTSDQNGNIFLTGSFFSPEITLGNTTLTNAIDFASTGDIFIAKLVNLETGLHEEIEALNVLIYPNPVRYDLFIRSELDLGHTVIQLIDALGRTVLLSDFDTVIDVGHLAPGIYVLKISDEGRSIFSERIVRDPY